jgi:hypothetical protein
MKNLFKKNEGGFNGLSKKKKKEVLLKAAKSANEQQKQLEAQYKLKLQAND